MKTWLFSHRRDARLERITGNVMVLVAALLACWAIWLGSSLPPDPLPQQWSAVAYTGLDSYSLTWVGLDCIEVLGLIACGLLFRRASPSARTVALLTVPVFFLDAWFDILTSVSKADLAAAAAMAVLGELPAACILGWVAWKALAFHQETRSGNRIRGGQATLLPLRSLRAADLADAGDQVSTASQCPADRNRQ